MSTVTHGMNVDEVEALGRLLQSKADQLRHVIGDLEAVLHRASWEGPDAAAFKQQWWPDHRGRLSAVADQVHGFGQSALNNASEQRTASGVAGGGGLAPGVVGAAAGAVGGAARAAAGGASGSGDSAGAAGMPPNNGRTWQEAQAAYEANGARLGLGRNYQYDRSTAAAADYGYQCTAWANFRWRELGWTGSDIAGTGGEIINHVPGPATDHPLAGAMVSSRSHNHVMIVEEVLDGGNRLRVSEMNTGTNVPRGSSAATWQDGDPQEFRSDRFLVRKGASWTYTDGSAVSDLVFKNHPTPNF